MVTEQGSQMMLAIKAVLDMQSDCIKLLEDFDRAMPEYKSLYGNVVTLGLGSSISNRRYLAEGLIRLYAREGSESEVLGINISFYDQNDRDFLEPILIAARITYLPPKPDQSEKIKRGWDPWYAFLAWIPERKYGEPIDLVSPPKRNCIERLTVAALPLFSIKSLSVATRLIDLVGRP